MRSVRQQFYYKNNRLQQLRGFCYAAQFGNLTRAAAHMGLTQPNVSLQIKALEIDFGVKLFQRKGRLLALTREGERLLELALPAVGSIENLQDEFQHETKSVKKTELHIAVNGTMKHYIMPPIASAYLKANPEIYLTIHFAEHDEAIKLLQAEEVDIAGLPRREHKPFPKGYEYSPVFFHTPSLITRRDHPLAGRKNLSVQEISRYELTLPAEDMRVIGNLYEIFPQNQISKKLRINFANTETGREYIEAGIVITISSDIWLDKDDTLVATPLSHLFPAVDYGFVRKRSKPMPDKVKRLLEIAQHHAGQRKIAA